MQRTANSGGGGGLGGAKTSILLFWLFYLALMKSVTSLCVATFIFAFLFSDICLRLQSV